MSNQNIGGQINVVANVSPAISSLDRLAQVMENAEKRGDKATAALAAKAIANAAKIVQANNRVAESEKRLTATVKAEATERVRIADASVQQARTLTEKARTSTTRARNKGLAVWGEQQRLTEETKIGGRVLVSGRQGEEARLTASRRAEEQRITNEQNRIANMQYMAESNRQKALAREHSEQIKQRTTLEKRHYAELRSEVRAVDAVIKRSLLAPEATRQRVISAVQGPQRMLERRLMQHGGMTQTQALAAQLAAVVGQQNAAFLAGGGRRPPGLGGGVAGGGSGGFGVLGRLFGMGGGGAMGGLVSSLAGGFGIGLGGYALAGGIRSATENVDRVTAYERQRVAAEQLAGSQEELNRMLEQYEESSGGAVDAATALANTTRLMATGFADSVEDLGKFVRATRGASIAMGKPQDYLIQETQLAISNTSFRRLDQIGLGIAEVRERMAELRQENQGMTRDVAFQIAVMDAMDEKYGHLSSSMEGQATDVELLRKVWQDFGLTIGDALKEPVDAAAKYIADRLKEIADGIIKTRENIDSIKEVASRQTTNPVMLDPNNMWMSPSPFVMPQTTVPGSRFRTHSLARGDFELGNVRVGRRGSDTNVELEQEREDAKVAWYQAGLALDKKFAAEILSTQRAYAMQRADVIRSYEQTIVREAQDFAKQRARAEEDYQESIVQLRRDSARAEKEAVEELGKSIARARRDHEERLADMADDYNRSVAENLQDFNESRAEQEEEQTERLEEIRKNGYDRLSELETSYNKQRLSAEEKHRETIENLASRVDARGIYEERRRFEREQSERLAERDEQKKKEIEKLEETTADAIREYEERQAKEQAAFDKAAGRAQANYDRQVAAEEKNYKRQLEDLNTAFQEQRAKAAENEEQRLIDMANAFQKRKDREDIDRAENLARMGTDHQNQLNEMAKQHDLRITQIKEQAAAEREQLDTEFEHRLGDLQLQTEDWYREQEQLVEDAIKAFDEWWEHVQGKLEVPLGHPSLGAEDPRDPDPLRRMTDKELLEFYQDSVVSQRGYKPGQDEWNTAQSNVSLSVRELERRGIPIPTISSFSDVYASASSSPVTTTSSGISTGNNYGGATYIVQSGAIQIQSSPGQSEEALGAIVEERLIRALEGAARSYA